MAGMNDTKIEQPFIKQLEEQAYQAAAEMIQVGGMKPGQILVIGCSTSEVAGEKIGSFSSPDMAEGIFRGISRAAREQEIYLAAQCCEHLNRALILEEDAAVKYGYELVNVVPQPKAGGSFATAAYRHFQAPVAVEHIKAHAGIDIGDTLIGMHLKDVAVPVRISVKRIGEARVVCARTRAKFVGGVRAVYDEALL
ncbi:MAG: TIGR01440 family protein [Lachnospiraceae bacterium]|nr:TIGR01440 family protein [Lachnospiraceae bacterium]